MNQARPLRLFISYSHRDDRLCRELETHLATLKRQGVIEVWSDRQIDAGAEWEPSIRRNLEAADIILLLVSPYFLASDFCHGQELKRAMERHETGDARVIPVFLRHCDWKGEPFGKLQGVPDTARPVVRWTDRDQAFTIVAEAIGKAAQSLRSPEPLSEPERPPHPTPPGPAATKDLPPGDATNDGTTKEGPKVAPTIAGRIRSPLSSIEQFGNNLISHVKGLCSFPFVESPVAGC